MSIDATDVHGLLELKLPKSIRLTRRECKAGLRAGNPTHAAKKACYAHKYKGRDLGAQHQDADSERYGVGQGSLTGGLEDFDAH